MPSSNGHITRKRKSAKLNGVAARGGPVASYGSYENAQTTRLRPQTGYRSGGSADSHRDARTLDTLRRQCQHLDRNNVLARGLAGALIDAVVSDGFNLQFHSGDAEWNRLAEDTLNLYFGWPALGRKAEELEELGGGDDGARYERLYGKVDLRGLWCIDEFAAEACRCALFEGDLLLVKTNRMGLQAIEAERIMNPGGGGGVVGFDQPGLVNGVQADADGRPLRFHVTEWTGMGGGMTAGGRNLEAADCLFLRNPMRAITGSTRGEPQMAAAIDRLEDLVRYDATVRVAAKLQSALAGFIKSNNPAALQESMAGSTETRTGDPNVSSERWVEIEPGMLKFLGPGEEAQFITSSQPGAQYEAFVTMQIIQVCTDLRLPISAVLLDGRGLNLSTIRSVLQFSNRATKRWQGWLTRCLYTPVTLWATAALIRAGELPFPEDGRWMAHSWTPPAPPVMDPKNEIDAGMAAINGRLKSRKRVMLEIFGIDFDEEMEQIAAEEATMKKLGFAPIGMPGQNVSPAAPGAEDGDGADPEDPAEEKTEGNDTGDTTDAPQNAAAGRKPPAAQQPSGGGGAYLVGDKTLAADLTKGVAGKTVPADSAKAILTSMVKLSPEEAGAIIDPADGFKQPEPAQTAAPQQ